MTLPHRRHRHPATGTPWRLLAAGTALLALGAVTPRAVPAQGTLEITCRDGLVAIDARSVPAAEVFRQLASRCGLAIRSPELLPEAPVGLVLRGRPLEEAVRELVRVAGVASTLSASGAGEPLTLYLLPTGAAGPAVPGEGPPTVPEGAAGEGAGSAAAADGDGAGDSPGALLAALAAIDPDEAGILAKMAAEDLLAERDDAATEALLRSILATSDEAERERLLDELNAVGPSPVTGEPWTPGGVADERWRLSWEGERRAFLLATDEGTRGAALELLRGLNDDEAAYLEGLDAAGLEDERALERIEELRERYLLSRSRDEWQRRLGPEVDGGETGPDAEPGEP